MNEDNYNKKDLINYLEKKEIAYNNEEENLKYILDYIFDIN